MHEMLLDLEIQRLQGILLLPQLHDVSPASIGRRSIMCGNHRKTVFEDTYLSFLNACREKGQVILQDLIKLIYMMQSNEMDCHIVIAGQNGCGKSYVLLMLLKEFMKLDGKQDPDWLRNMMLSDKTTDDFVQFLLLNENTILGVDELNQYLFYKQHAEDQQNHLIKQLELARSKRIAIAGCVRDPRKLTLNYRQGKMSIVIWLVDRYTDGGSYAAVFVANPAVETTDKFGFSYISADMIDFEELRCSFEGLPSFIGYMAIPNISGFLTQKEIETYKIAKRKSMALAHLNYCVERVRKKRISIHDFIEELNKLRQIIGDTDAVRLLAKAEERAGRPAPARRGRPSADDIEDLSESEAE